MIKRLVVNLTNHCNEYCPFCCVEASCQNHNFMKLETLQDILDSYSENIEVQMTGGEPTLHPHFISCVRKTIEHSNVSKLIIDTNGTEMEKIAFTLNKVSQEGSLKILMKISVNYWLTSQHPDLLDRLKKVVLDHPSSDRFEIILSVAHRIPEMLDKDILDRLDQSPFNNLYQIRHPIAFQGRARRNKLPNTCLDKMKIIAAEPIAYATDGSCFGSNLERRNQYELEY